MTYLRVKHEDMEKFDKLKWQREARKKNGNAWNKKYEKTKNGFLMRTYRNMKSRTSGIQWKKAHLYKGLELLDKDTFKKWSINNDDFNVLFEKWEESGYDRRLSPSIDRIDSSIGYRLSNMRWITHSENSIKGNNSRFRKTT